MDETPAYLPEPVLAQPGMVELALGRPVASQGQGLLVFLTPHRFDEALLLLAAHLSCRGPLRVLDTGNCFKAYALSRAVRRLTREPLDQVLGRVQVARAFTCYQSAALLEAAAPHPIPTLVADLLNTFYDEDVALLERRRLLAGCIEHLRRLSQDSVVAVSLRPPPAPQVDSGGFMEMVQAAADRIWLQEEIVEPQPLRLF